MRRLYHACMVLNDEIVILKETVLATKVEEIQPHEDHWLGQPCSRTGRRWSKRSQSARDGLIHVVASSLVGTTKPRLLGLEMLATSGNHKI